MATAKKTTKTVYTLTLTEEEAAALYRTTDFVGGVPALSPRGLIDKIRLAMRNAGAPNGVELEIERKGIDGIYFKDKNNNV